LYLLDHELYLIAAEGVFVGSEMVVEPKIVITKMANTIGIRLQTLFKFAKQRGRSVKSFVVIIPT